MIDDQWDALLAFFIFRHNAHPGHPLHEWFVYSPTVRRRLGKLMCVCGENLQCSSVTGDA